METRGILLLLMKSLRLRLDLLGDSAVVLPPVVGGKKFWIVGFFGLFILLAPADMVSPGCLPDCLGLPAGYICSPMYLVLGWSL